MRTPGSCLTAALLLCACPTIGGRTPDTGGAQPPDAALTADGAVAAGDGGVPASPDASGPGRDAAPPPEPGDLVANTWVRVADSPGDPEGREVPPGRASTWVYEPTRAVLLRYGGYTPRFSNAMDAFDPAALTWSRLFAEDENYPDTRPGGGCAWTMQYDEARKRVWLVGGLGNGETGSRGVWTYDPATKTFEKFAQDLPPGITRATVDLAAGVVVASPRAGIDENNKTWLFDLTAKTWTSYPTSPCPQGLWAGGYASVYDESLKQVVVMGSDGDAGQTVWTFDVAAKAWTKLATNEGPSKRSLFAAAYDPDHKVIVLHGVHPGGNEADRGAQSDTWILDVAAKTWTEIATPGPTPLTTGRGVETTYKLALSYDRKLKRFFLFDADLGVWAFRYDPGSPAGAKEDAKGFVPQLGKAAANAPVSGPAEIRRSLPSATNQRILDLGDNQLLSLGGGVVPGAEVGWWYDSDAGVLVKYGGCGNTSSPYWNHYGNDLVYYDPGVERWFTRRVGDVSGALRPGNGCTRSVVYDPARKLSWFFGGVGSGPYCQAPQAGPGSFAYGISTDRFELLGDGLPSEMGNPGCNVAFGPEAGVGIWPDDGKTWVFDSASASWTAKDSPTSPGKAYTYTRIAWLKSRKVFFALGGTGNGGGGANTTVTYDPATNTWTDLQAQNQPPFRASKYGLVHDSKNDVVLLMGGSVSWNADWRNDLWAYSFATNRWEKLTPQVAGGGKGTDLTDNMPSAYDERHNAVIFTDSNYPWAYRYKK
ncbi:MAG: hypothetical protein QM765_37760 [Myxococcales bacterium]